MVRNEGAYTRAMWRMMEQLLEVEDLEEALSGTLSIILETLHSEAGALWFLDKDSDRLYPAFHVGPADISGVSIENGVGIEGIVSKTGKSILITDCRNDPRFQDTVFDDHGLKAESLICVPLNDMHEILGCIQIINKKDKETYNEDELLLCERMAALAALTIDEKGLIIKEAEHREVLVRLSNVIKDYPSGEGVLHVLKGINLEIYHDEFVVLLGESGCGKTTIMNIIGGMDSLTDGTVTIDGEDYSHPTDEKLMKYRRQFIGFIFQAYNLMPNLTALENVRLIADLVDEPMQAEDAIGLVGLEAYADHFPNQMSGGQQQRVSIARAIVKKPTLILADEPTAALDYQTGIEVLTVIEEIVRTQGTTVLMVTHNPEIAKMADRVVRIRSGKVASIKRNMHPLHAKELVW